MKYLIFLLIIFIFSSCIEGDNDYRNKGDGTQISIFLVKSMQLHMDDPNIDLNSLELESKPWVKSSEIEFYDWSSHTFFLNTEKEKAKYSGRYFVVVSGEERLFLGTFFSMFMSSIPSVPSILAEDGMFSPKDVVCFGQLGHQFTGEINQQPEFKKALISSGLLRSGIKAELMAVKKKNGNTVIYTFEVTNLGNENLYILDPDRMGASHFHYVCNGVWFSKSNTYYFPSEIENTAFEKVDNNWYFKLRPKQTMTRSVELTNFPEVPEGKIKCRFSFPGSMIKKSGDWKKSDGRVWLGEFFVEKELELK